MKSILQSGNQEKNQTTDFLSNQNSRSPKVSNTIFTAEENKKTVEFLLDGIPILEKAIKKMEEKEKIWLQLEEKDFRIEDTSKWKEIKVTSKGNKTKIKVSPSGDVWEFIEGEFKGKQLFTQKAAIRETVLLGKKLPTIEQWGAIIKSINPNIDLNGFWQDDTSVRETLKLELSGHRAILNIFRNQGEYGSFWSSSKNYSIIVNNTRIYHKDGLSNSNGIAVRCFKK